MFPNTKGRGPLGLPCHGGGEGLLLTVALLANLYVTDIEVDEHAVLFVLGRLIVVVAQGPIQPQGKPVAFPTAQDGACVTFQTSQAG